MLSDGINDKREREREREKLVTELLILSKYYTEKKKEKGSRERSRGFPIP